MKGLFRIFGFVALVAIIGLGITSCPEELKRDLTLGEVVPEWDLEPGAKPNPPKNFYLVDTGAMFGNDEFDRVWAIAYGQGSAPGAERIFVAVGGVQDKRDDGTGDAKPFQVIAYAKAANPEEWKLASFQFEPGERLDWAVRNIVFGEKLGRFVAIDYGNFNQPGHSNKGGATETGDAENRFIASRSWYSDDGVNWKGPYNTHLRACIGLGYANGIYVTAGHEDQIAWSEDGIAWTTEDTGIFRVGAIPSTNFGGSPESGDNSILRGFAYIPKEDAPSGAGNDKFRENGRWITVGDRGWTAYNDENLKTGSWVRIQVPGFQQTQPFQRVIYKRYAEPKGEIQGGLLAPGSTGRMYYSDDYGKSWKTLGRVNLFGDQDAYNIVDSGEPGGFFVVTGAGGRVGYSDKEIDEYLQFQFNASNNQYGSSTQVHGIAYGNGYWITGGRSGQIQYSNVRR